MSRDTTRYPKIELLFFANCPLADAARASLMQALAELSIATYDEIDLLDPTTPDELRGWGSPTILVGGEDVSGAPKGESIGCRVYQEPGRVPSPATIVAAIRGKSRLRSPPKTHESDQVAAIARALTSPHGLTRS